MNNVFIPCTIQLVSCLSRTHREDCRQVLWSENNTRHHRNVTYDQEQAVVFASFHLVGMGLLVLGCNVGRHEAEVRSSRMALSTVNVTTMGLPSDQVVTVHVTELARYARWFVEDTARLRLWAGHRKPLVLCWTRSFDRVRLRAAIGRRRETRRNNGERLKREAVDHLPVMPRKVGVSFSPHLALSLFLSDAKCQGHLPHATIRLCHFAPSSFR